MGLTVSFGLQSRKRKTGNVASQLIRVMQACQHLPLESISTPTTIDADKIAEKTAGMSPREFYNLHHGNDPVGQMIATNCETVRRESPPVHEEIFPEAIIWSNVRMFPGSEDFSLKLCQYQRRINVEYSLAYNYRRRRDYTKKYKQIPTHLGGWRGGDFCKTIYASLPRYGGLLNFLTVHLTVCKVLEECERAGFVVDVNDEGDFWDHRDLARLALYVMGDAEPLTQFHLEQLRRRFNAYGLPKVPELDDANFETVPDYDRLLVAYRLRERPQAMLEEARQHRRIKVRPTDGGSSET